MEVDVLIVGAGPAGAAAALTLAPDRRVLMVDRLDDPAPRIGECLPGAARRLMSDMELWEDFLADGHRRTHAFRSAWGGPEPDMRDGLADPDGCAWSLDRAKFERRLRASAVDRGAALLAPARPADAAREDGGWRVRVAHGRGTEAVRTRLVIDAAGRSSRLLAPFGARRRPSDRLVCGWLRCASAAAPPGLVQIEAEPDGWWYAAPLPAGGGLLAFHTDADLAAARTARSAATLLERARRLPMLGELADDERWAGATAGVCAAHSSALERPVGEGWIAAGDAALSFDPLSSQGLFNALYTGLMAARAAERTLSGDADALEDYAADLAGIGTAYGAHLRAWYGMERRWPGRPFWRRRLAPMEAPGMPAMTSIAESAAPADHVPA